MGSVPDLVPGEKSPGDPVGDAAHDVTLDM